MPERHGPNKYTGSNAPTGSNAGQLTWWHCLRHDAFAGCLGHGAVHCQLDTRLIEARGEIGFTSERAPPLQMSLLIQLSAASGLDRANFAQLYNYSE